MTTYSALYYHLIWSTKNRNLLIPELIEDNLHAYIAGIVKGKTSRILQVGGMPDHIHILIRLSPDQNISEIVKSIKTSSSNWLKQNNQLLKDFFWQEGYGVFTVSKSQVDVVKNYILTQKEHHRKGGFDREWVGFLQNHEIEYDEKYVFG